MNFTFMLRLYICSRFYYYYYCYYYYHYYYYFSIYLFIYFCCCVSVCIFHKGRTALHLVSQN